MIAEVALHDPFMIRTICASNSVPDGTGDGHTVAFPSRQRRLPPLFLKTCDGTGAEFLRDALSIWRHEP
jgi:hypothetical protein